MVVLSGELGAGKTTLVRAIAAARGVDPRNVSSPTFTVLHEYAPDEGPVIVHADAYRLEGDDETELDLLGWDRVAGGGGVLLIEWGERIESLLEGEHARIVLGHDGPDSRLLTLEAPDAWGERAEWSAWSGARSGFPFASEREQWADLYRWFSGGYRISRPIEDPDEQVE